MCFSKLKIHSCDVIEEITDFLNPFEFRVTFECLDSIEEKEFEWKIVYVGSAETEDFDQTLLHEHYGPFTVGQHSIILKSNPPDQTKIPEEELVGTTIIFIIGRLKSEKGYYQIGYFVSNEYVEQGDSQSSPVYKKLQRRVVKDNPRIFIE